MAQRTWFITSINGGSGSIMLQQFLKRGDRVAGNARKVERLNDLSAKYGDPLWISLLDLTDTPAIPNLIDPAFAHFGGIEVVVLNAGYTQFSAAEEVTDEHIVHRSNTNLISSIQAIVFPGWTGH